MLEGVGLAGACQTVPLGCARPPRPAPPNPLPRPAARRAGWRVLQGTFLPSGVAEDLAQMQAHPALKAATQRLQALYAQVARRPAGCRGQRAEALLARRRR